MIAAETAGILAALTHTCVVDQDGAAPVLLLQALSEAAD